MMRGRAGIKPGLDIPPHRTGQGKGLTMNAGTDKARHARPQNGRPTVGLLCNLLHNEYDTNMWRGVRDAAWEHGGNLIYFSSGCTPGRSTRAQALAWRCAKRSSATAGGYGWSRSRARARRSSSPSRSTWGNT